ncbi:hypothetical protein C8J27_10345 [Rhodobacter aestuarii]|uniref:4Fe-4S ferredoxin-type domain-containing protein n=1 Tax=Rhodobacter aestuarii TaxID=453582 RepID=A0A1N7KFM8_9RHOB|nr:ferredoxin [Rhodobacter aestuarii]PTV95718.1 hypothetical protein C8J27_10345 [Rhodobacter aestuarii]SIS60274.1 hypothetical protein SAMN05421580_102389 [Rhodobacter aestuarii]
MNLPERLTQDLDAARLFVAGAVLEGEETILLLAPDEPGFWPHVTAQPEFADGARDPLDRWSRRVIEAMATAHGGRAILPSDGPPYAPFFQWALGSGQAFASPVQMLVHARMGLWTSFRGALALPERLPQPAPAANPCPKCDAPCATACPVNAFGAGGYDTAACHNFLNTSGGEICLSGGCLARRACPLSESYGRLASQSAWHMRQFHT